MDVGLQPENRGDYYLCVCPACNEKRAYVYLPKSDSDIPTAICNRANNCGFESRIYDMVCEKEGGKDRGKSYLRSLSKSAKPRAYAPRPEPKLIRLPKDEVNSYWRSCAGIGEEHPHKDKARTFLEERNISLDSALELDRVRLASLSPRPWWPYGSAWLVVKAFEPDGTFASVHGRSLVPGSKDKRWPKGPSAGGLVFGTAYEQAFLRGEVDDAPFIAIAEGLTDWLRLRTRFDRKPEERGVVVLGVTSGSAPLFNKIKWPTKRLTVKIATDDDAKGDEYAEKIAKQIPRHLMPVRIRL